MARCCGSTGTCACKITPGRNITVTGTGTSQDPFVVSSITMLNVEDTAQFNLVLAGDGTLESPWTLSVDYSAAAGLDGLPDVDTAGVTNGQVLAWDDAAQQWAPAPPTTAATGGNLTGNGIEGDGSAGAPLEVTADAARFITVTTDGVGLSDEGINSLFRVYATGTDRAADPLPPGLSMLETAPGRIDYWNGSAWAPIDAGTKLAVQSGEFLALSGAYAGGATYDWVGQIDAITDANGDFEVISMSDLSAFAGVLHCTVQETGTLAWKAVVRADTNRVLGRAFRIDNGTAYGGYAITATVRALLY